MDSISLQETLNIIGIRGNDVCKKRTRLNYTNTIRTRLGDSAPPKKFALPCNFICATAWIDGFTFCFRAFSFHRTETPDGHIVTTGRSHWPAKLSPGGLLPFRSLEKQCGTRMQILHRILQQIVVNSCRTTTPPSGRLW